MFARTRDFIRRAAATDRPIDGIDLTAFFTGDSAESGRESILCFVGDALHAVKWRNWT